MKRLLATHRRRRGDPRRLRIGGGVECDRGHGGESRCIPGSRVHPHAAHAAEAQHQGRQGAGERRGRQRSHRRPGGRPAGLVGDDPRDRRIQQHGGTPDRRRDGGGARLCSQAPHQCQARRHRLQRRRQDPARADDRPGADQGCPRHPAEARGRHEDQRRPRAVARRAHLHRSRPSAPSYCCPTAPTSAARARRKSR